MPKPKICHFYSSLTLSDLKLQFNDQFNKLKVESYQTILHYIRTITWDIQSIPTKIKT